MGDFLQFAFHDGAFFTFSILALILWAAYGLYIYKRLN